MAEATVEHSLPPAFRVGNKILHPTHAPAFRVLAPPFLEVPVVNALPQVQGEKPVAQGVAPGLVEIDLRLSRAARLNGQFEVHTLKQAQFLGRE